MSEENQPRRFRPARPIVLHEKNTGFKKKIEVEFAIEKLRKIGWLVTYGENIRPIHFCFTDDTELAEFKKHCEELNITLKQPVQTIEEIEEVIENDNKTVVVPNAEEKDSKGYKQIQPNLIGVDS